MLRLPTALKSLEYISSLHYADCLADLIHLNSSLRDNHGVAGIMLVCGAKSDSQHHKLQCLGLGAFSSNHKLFIDPVKQDYSALADIGLSFESPFCWNTARRTHGTSLAWNLFDISLERAGMRAGYSMCAQAYENDERFLFAHIASTDDQLNAEQASLFEYIMPYLTRTAAKHWLFSDDLLTVKQREIIDCLRKGMDTNKISKELKIPARAIRFHFRKICEITQTEDISEAITLLNQLSVHKALTVS